MIAQDTVVRIHTQPSNLPSIGILNRTAVVREVKDGMADVTVLKTTDDCGGSGWVPLSCLCPESDADRLAAGNSYLRHLNLVYEQSMARTDRANAWLTKIGARYGLTLEQMRSLRNEVAKAEGNDWW